MKQLLLIAFLSFAISACETKNEEVDNSGTASPESSTNGSAAPSAHEGMAMTGNLSKDMRKMNAQMVEALGPADSNYDGRFIDMMIPHHEGAIDMARDAKKKSQRPEIQKLADDIIAAQEEEIAQLKQWKAKWYRP